MSSFLVSDLKIINFVSCIIGSAFLLFLFLREKKMLVKLLFFSLFYTPGLDTITYVNITIHIISLTFPWFSTIFYCLDLYIHNFLNFTHLFFENRTPFSPFWVQILKNITIENFLRIGPIYSFFEFKKWRIYGNKWEIAETCTFQHILDLITYVGIAFYTFIPKIPSHISHLLHSPTLPLFLIIFCCSSLYVPNFLNFIALLAAQQKLFLKQRPFNNLLSSKIEEFILIKIGWK